MRKKILRRQIHKLLENSDVVILGCTEPSVTAEGLKLEKVIDPLDLVVSEIFKKERVNHEIHAS